MVAVHVSAPRRRLDQPFADRLLHTARGTGYRLAPVATGRALRPVEAIRAEVAEITERDLGRRVPVPASRDEVARLAVTANATRDRLEESTGRQRRFVADASHELRDPFAALRAHVEVAITHPRLPDGPELLGDVVRVQRLADDLLLPARLDAGRRAERVPLDLGETVRATVARRPAGRFPVRLEAAGPAPVRGNRRRNGSGSSPGSPGSPRSTPRAAGTPAAPGSGSPSPRTSPPRTGARRAPRRGAGGRFILRLPADSAM